MYHMFERYRIHRVENTNWVDSENKGSCIRCRIIEGEARSWNSFKSEEMKVRKCKRGSCSNVRERGSLVRR